MDVILRWVARRLVIPVLLLLRMIRRWNSTVKSPGSLRAVPESANLDITIALPPTLHDMTARAALEIVPAAVIQDSQQMSAPTPTS